MSEQSNPIPGTTPLSVLAQEPPDHLAKTLQKFAECELHVARIGFDLKHLTFSFKRGNVTVTLRLTLTLPSLLSEKVAIHRDPELSVSSDGEPEEWCRLPVEDAWQLVVRLCGSECDRLRRSSVQPELPRSTVSRILVEEAIERVLSHPQPFLFCGRVLTWAAIAAARGAEVSVCAPEGQTRAIDFLPARSDGTLVVDRTWTTEPMDASVLRAFGGENVLYLHPQADSADEDPIARILEDHWRPGPSFEVPHPRHDGTLTYGSMWTRRAEDPAHPEEDHRVLLARARMALADKQPVGPEADAVLAHLWADGCPLHRESREFAIRLAGSFG